MTSVNEGENMVEPKIGFSPTVSLRNCPQDFHQHQRAEELQITAGRGAVMTSAETPHQLSIPLYF